jgi:tripartite-type tricarboxylate transporter receptor subunit TctC
MKINMHNFFAACGLVFACMAAAAAADTPAYPARPIRLLIPFPPGGGADTLARIITPKLYAALGQQWVIDNRGGAAGNIATEVVAKAAPDGYTLLLDFSTALTVNPSLYKLPFDVLKDLQPIALLAGAQYMLVLHPSVKADNLKEFIELVKANPGKLNYASAGVGSPLHLAAELFKYRGGLNIVHVPYKGGGPAAAAVLGGEAQVLFGSFASSYPHVKSGRLKGIAVTGPKRSPVAPEIPTIAEAAFPGFDVSAWYGLSAPAKTPQAIINLLQNTALKVVQLPDVQEAFSHQGLDVTPKGSAEFAVQIKKETEVWAKVIKAAGIHAE